MFIHLLRHYLNDLAVAITATHHMSHYFQPVQHAAKHLTLALKSTFMPVQVHQIENLTQSLDISLWK